MSKLWQLKTISTGAPLNDPQPLPENWGPIFGLSGIVDQLGDLSWLGEEYTDKGWFVVGDAPTSTPATPAEIAWNRAKELLERSDWSMLPDVPMISSEKEKWIEYRRALREIKLQAQFPDNIIWPTKPD